MDSRRSNKFREWPAEEVYQSRAGIAGLEGGMWGSCGGALRRGAR